MLINRYNFLRWEKPQTPGFTPDIPLAYKADAELYYPYLVPGETTSFYINAMFNQDIRYSLRVIGMDGIAVSADIATLSKLAIIDDQFELYCSFVNPNVVNGFYKLGVFANNTLVLQSNPVFITNQNYQKYTSVLKFRHSGLIYGVNYDKLPGDFYQQFRLHITEIDRQAQYNKDQYRSALSNKLRNLYSVTDMYVTFETYYFDDLAHEAITATLDHDELYINNHKFNFKTGHKKNTHQQNSLQKGQFELWDEGFTQAAVNDNTDLVILEFSYLNTAVTHVFIRNNCASNYQGSNVSYTVPAGTYSSIISQADADALALNDINANGQTYANTTGTCTLAYGNVERSQVFTKNSCIGSEGSDVTYTVPAGSYTSIVSQAAANALADADITANGQAYANAQGVCTFYNVAINRNITKNNCSFELKGSSVAVSVPARTYNSLISQLDADTQAENYAQAYANTNGSCSARDVSEITVQVNNGKVCNVTFDAPGTTYDASITSNVVTGHLLRGVTYNVTLSGTFTTCVFFDSLNGSGTHSAGIAFDFTPVGDLSIVVA